MKRRPRLISPLLPLFAVLFVMVAAFPTDLLASRMTITIKNNSKYDIDFGSYNGKDTVCLFPRNKVTVYNKDDPENQKEIHCDGQGKHSCKLYGNVGLDSGSPDPVGILGKPTTTKAGCKHAKRVENNKTLTCEDGASHPTCS